MVPRTAILRNPISGRGKMEGVWRRFLAAAESQGLGFDVVETESALRAPGQAHDLARRYEVVVAAGGDGTVSDVANGLQGTDAALALLPMGTGNDLARTLGVFGNPEEVVRRLVSGQERRIDACRWVSGGRSGLSVNVAGTGFDAAVAERINRGIRNLTGTPAYLAAILSELWSHQPARFRLTIDGETMETSAMLCSVANSNSYGGGLMIAPEAELADGLLDLVLVEAVGKPRFLAQFLKVTKGAHVDLPEVICQKVRRVDIQTDPPLPVLCDGEVVGRGDVSFEVVPGAVKLRA